MIRRSVALAVILLISVSPAYGDWEYTKYGMNVDEVIAASEGKARRLSKSEAEGKRVPTGTAMAAADHQTGPFDFEVVFYAELGGSKLQTVRLTLKGQNSNELRAQVNDLRNALSSKYGKPINKEVQENEFFTTNHWDWQADSNNIRLTYADGMANMAWIEYKQRLSDLAL